MPAPTKSDTALGSSRIRVFVVAETEVHVTRKSVRNMNLRVTRDARVIASVPTQATDAQVNAFLHERSAWILRHLAIARKRLDATTAPIADGAVVPLWDGDHPVAIRRNAGARKALATLQGDGNVVITLPDPLPEAAETAVARECELAMRVLRVSELRRELPAVRERAEELTGLLADEWRVRPMTTRWGSYSVGKHRVWLSSELAKYPIACTDYVAVHELCHILEPNHGVRFHRLLRRWCPDWQDLKAILDDGARRGV